MSEDSTFRDLIRRVRAGDEQAAEELLQRYEPAIRRTVRARLRDSRLRRLLDSMDICQSVLGSFFVNAALGRYDLDRPEHLLQLLTSMAHHKLTNAVHKQQAARRDHRRLEPSPITEFEVVGRGSSPSQHVAARELLQEAQRRLSPEERQLLELREQGHEWAAIATTLGGNPEALRKKLARAVERVARQLGLDEVSHE
jgi:RNA polymerase sigma-70 factor (ECF subfamily)